MRSRLGFGTVIASVCGLALVCTHTTVVGVPTLIARNRYVLSAAALMFIAPFGVPANLFSQTELSATSGDLRGLRVDPQTAQFFRVARRFVLDDNEFHPGAPVIAAYDLPGLVYVLGGVSLGAPWFFADEPQQQLNCVELRSRRLNKLRRSVVLVMPAMRPSFSQCLHSVGIAFPEQYHLVGAVRSPYDSKMVRVFVPNTR